MSDLGPIAEAVSAFVAVVAFIQSCFAQHKSKAAEKSTEGLKAQMNALNTQMQNLQAVQANAQRTNINIAVTTAPNATLTERLPEPGRRLTEEPTKDTGEG